MGVWRVFLSHTSELAEYPAARPFVAAAKAAVTRAGEVPVDMSDFTARDEPPAQYCRERLGSSDVYVAVVGFRYGSLVPELDPISYTELEFNVATELGLPRLVFCLHEESSDLRLPPKACTDPERGASQVAFRRRLGRPAAGLTLCFVNSADHLETSLYQALVERRKVQGENGQATGTASVDGADPRIPASVLQAYFTRLDQQYRRLDLEALTPAQRDEHVPIALRSVFVPQDVRENPPPVELPKEIWRRLEAGGEIQRSELPAGLDEATLAAARKSYSAHPRRPVLELLSGGDRLLVLLGDPGAGKSSLARYSVLRMTDEQTPTAPTTLPLFIELRALAQTQGRFDTFVEYIDHLARTDGLGVPAKHLVPYLRAGADAQVVFDGLDEIFEPAQRDAVARRIAGFAVEFPHVRIIVTSRIIGYRRSILTDAGFAHYTIQDLDRAQTSEFLTRWYSVALGEDDGRANERRSRLTAAIAGSRPIEELASNPLLLTILAIIGKHQELPRERWEVYDHAASVLVEHWDVNRYLRDRRVEANFIGKEDKRELLRRIANRMQSGRHGLIGNVIHHDDLVGEIEAYLQERYQRDPASSKVIAEEMINQFRERNFILSRYGAEVYGFVHRAFLEFFCAEHIRRRFERTQEMSAEDLRRDVFGRRWEEDSWREVLLLIAGMLHERFVAGVIEYLLRDANLPWLPRFNDRPPRNVLLAVRCLAEMRNRHVGAGAARLLLGQVIDLIERSGDGEQTVDAFLDDELLPAVAQVGADWPGREEAFAWFQAIGALIIRTPACRFASRLLACLFPDRDEVATLLRARAVYLWDWTLRDAAVAALGQYAAEPASSSDVSLTVLRGCAERDPVAVVRWRAVEAVADRSAPGAELWEWLQARLEQEISTFVRVRALKKLIETRPEPPDLEARLRGLADQDPAADLRRAAADELAARAAGSPETAAWLRARLHTAGRWEIRHAALRAVRVPDPAADEDLLAVVRDRAESDLHPTVRAEAIRVAARQWRSRPGMRAWVCGRVERDDLGSVRQAVIEAVASGWADEPATHGWLVERLEREAIASGRLAAARALLTLLPRAERPPRLVDVLRAAAERDPDMEVRRTILRGLADSDRDGAAAVPWLAERATVDPDSGVRGEVIKSIGRVWKDPDATVAWLMDRSERDPDRYPRQSALAAIASAWADDPRVAPWLRQRAETDEVWSVRENAVVHLAQLRESEPADGRAWLMRRGSVDADEDVRLTALRAAAQRWGQADDVRSWLRERAVNDPDEDVRLAALTALARGARDDPPTLPLLRQRVVADPHWDVKARATVLIVEGWPDDPRTVPWLLDNARDADWNIQSPAIAALCRVWPLHPVVAPLLRDIATGHRYGNPRRWAIESLALHHPDRAGTAALLAERAVAARNSGNRQMALFALVQGWSADPMCRRVVRQAAVRDPARRVRLQAVSYLDGPAGSGGVGRLLREIAENDDAANVRAEAVAAYSRLRPPPARLRAWLVHRVDDRSSDVAAQAAQALAQLADGSPARLRHLLGIVQSDPRWKVRRAAFRALDNIRGDAPDDLVAATQGWSSRRERVVRAATAGHPGSRLDDPVSAPWPQLRAHLPSQSWQERRRIVRAVAAARRDEPETPRRLSELMRTEDDWSVRCALVNGIAAARTADTDVLVWLRDRATADRDARVRAAAVRAVGWHGRDDPAVRSWITDQAVVAHRGEVRRAALRALAADPGSWDELRPWLQKRATEDNVVGLVWRTALRLLVTVAPADPQTADFLRGVASSTAAEEVRSFALRLLAHCTAPDRPSTMAVLLRHAEQDTMWHVRRAALDALARHFCTDPGLVDVARRRAETDVAGETRRAARRAMIAALRGDPGAACAWLRERAVLDADWQCRREAIRLVARLQSGDIDMMRWLRERVRSDPYGTSREEAVAAVARYWAAEPEVLPWLHELATGAGWSEVRRAAGEAIARHWPSEPDSVAVVRRLACNDVSPEVREAMAWVLARTWRDDPETLPWLRLIVDLEDTEATQDAMAWALTERNDAAFWLTYGLSHHQQELAELEAAAAAVGRR
ncbi:NACHT domain-containing protein [Frankia sp. AiPs1]|uniref:HEAT repeat domain-containing protein n=1 Tax=Frankia sp. AiPa1 TaxID=573492 RepID=UPI00202B71DB|nr:HEAT repeat domain-containing protein [Frankia sp. AiPa1]MCL9762608.1 HEAT repeat domain-containing protein [Frankia sp. AiPa1]